MTCREKLMMEHPNDVSSEWSGGCCGCPHDYNYMTKPPYCPGGANDRLCTRCWDRKIPETKPKLVIPWDEVYNLINESMEKRDRSVSVYFHPENGLSVNVYPWPDAEDLWEMYKDGRISENDFREKIGLKTIEEADLDKIRTMHMGTVVFTKE